MFLANWREGIASTVGAAGTLRGQLVRGGLSSLLIRVGYIPLQFAISIALARSLGPDGLGVYAFTIALMTILVIPAHLGFPSFLVKMVSVYLLRAQHSLLKGLLHFSTVVVLIASAAVCLIAAMAIASGHVIPADMSRGPILIGLALVPLLSLLSLNGGALRGLGYVVASQVPEQLLRPALLLLMVLAMLVGQSTLTAAHAMLANVGATAIALAVAAVAFAKRAPPAAAAAQPALLRAEWTRSALPFLLLASAQVLNHQIDILMLGFMMSRQEVGVYRVAVQLADGMGMFLIALTAAMAPALARLHAEENWPAIQRVLVAAHRTGFVLLLPVALVLSLAAPIVVTVLFGDQFISAAQPLAILALGKLGYAAVGFAGLALSMFGLAGVATVVTALTAVVNIGLNLVLIPRFGNEGAAFATAFSSLSLSVGCVIWMHSRFGIDISALGLRRLSEANAQ